MRISIALCTYNGGRFLAEQLASIGAQTRPPDELVVCDDASADDTVAIARAFAARAPFRVRVEVNPTNLRSTANFARAIGLCTGDVIALSDQDDVWLPHKLDTLARALAAAPDAGFAFTNAAVVDDRLVPLGYTLWDAIRFGRAEQERFRRGGAFAGLLRKYRVTGATMAFRTAYRDLILPIPCDWVHDAWIALVIAAVAPCVPVAECLIRYRQHPAQQLGEAKRGLYGQYRVARTMTRATYEAVAARYADALSRLQSVPGVAPEHLGKLAGKVNHFRRRTAMREPGAWRLPLVWGEIRRGNYRRFSLGWKAVAQDLLL